MVTFWPSAVICSSDSLYLFCQTREFPSFFQRRKKTRYKEKQCCFFLPTKITQFGVLKKVLLSWFIFLRTKASKIIVQKKEKILRFQYFFVLSDKQDYWDFFESCFFFNQLQSKTWSKNYRSLGSEFFFFTFWVDVFFQKLSIF